MEPLRETVREHDGAQGAEEDNFEFGGEGEAELKEEDFVSRNKLYPPPLFEHTHV